MSFKAELISDIDYKIISNERHIKECEKTIALATSALADYNKEAAKLQKRKEWVNNLPDCE